MNRMILGACSLLLVASTPVVAGDEDAGKNKTKTCAACHGTDGNTPTAPDIPRLGGQHYDYLVMALQGYKSGARKNPIMNPLAANLSQRDIQDVAAYFASQKGVYFKY